MKTDQAFLEKGSVLLESAKRSAKAAVDLIMVYAYFEIGRLIFEEKQKGKTRAQYGQHVISD